MDQTIIIKLKNFDENGEPEIRLYEDGSLHVVFNFMPPLTEKNTFDDSYFNNFGLELQKNIGAAVIWEDREFFLVQKPKANTVDRIKNYIENYWDNQPS